MADNQTEDMDCAIKFKEEGLYGVPKVMLKTTWPRVIEMLKPAIARTRGRFEDEDVFDSIKNKKMQLWCYAKDDEIYMSCVTQLINYPSKKYMRIVFVGADKHRDYWKSTIKQLEVWAKSLGCDGVENSCRKGWARVSKEYGYGHESIILDKEF